MYFTLSFTSSSTCHPNSGGPMLISLKGTSRRKIAMSVEEVIAAVNSLDLKLLSLENVEILQTMVPTKEETKAYKEYVDLRKNINLLTEDDKFLLELGKVEGISAKLSIMNYFGNFFDDIDRITAQIHAIISAYNSVKSSKKFPKVLQIILAFGNYLNRNKRGPAYGFKLQSLDMLLDVKSTDRSRTLLHYIVDTVRHKFPELLDFESEFMNIDKAAVVSLENIIMEVNHLEKGMNSIRKEAQLQKSAKECISGQSIVLRDFLEKSEVKLRQLKANSRTAQCAFKKCVIYFADSPHNADADTFFSMLVRFVRAFKLADQENQEQRRLEQAALKAPICKKRRK